MTKAQGRRSTRNAEARAVWYSPASIGRSLVLRPRVLIAAAITIALFLLLPGSLQLAAREAIAWCVGGCTYIALAVAIMLQCDSDRIRERAAKQDDSAVLILVLILAAIFSSLVAIFGLLSEAKQASDAGKIFFVALAGGTIIVSWFVTQFAFTLHYAHEYYAPDNFTDAIEESETAMKFPGDKTPDYWDFLYFATSFGAASQTSDVSINTKSMRRLTTLHAVVSFFFNTMVLALAINLAASLA
jgi:uncharacterized membrane protein